MPLPDGLLEEVKYASYDQLRSIYSQTVLNFTKIEYQNLQGFSLGQLGKAHRPFIGERIGGTRLKAYLSVSRQILALGKEARAIMRSV